MIEISAIGAPASSLRAVRGPAAGWLRNGAFHVVVLIPVIWALNLVDLLFTVLASQDRNFVELNPLAGHLTGMGKVVLKLAMLTIFTFVMIAWRRRRLAHLGCYLLLAVYGTLAVVWFTAFDFLLSGQTLSQIVHSLR